MLMLQNKVTDLFTSFIKNLVTSYLHSSQCCDIYLHCHPVSFSSVWTVIYFLNYFYYCPPNTADSSTKHFFMVIQQRGPVIRQ